MPDLPSLPGLDLIARSAASATARARHPVHVRMPSLPSLPVRPPVRLAGEIAFFGYSTWPYDGDTTPQEDIFAASPLTGAVRRVTDDREGEPRSDRDPAWSPDRHWLAIQTATAQEPESRLRIVSARTGAVAEELGHGYRPTWLDATTLLYLDTTEVRGVLQGPDVYTVDIVSSAVHRITDIGRGAQVTGLSWHPTAGLALAYTGPPPGRELALAVVPAATVAAARTPRGHPVTGSLLTTVVPGNRVTSPHWAAAGNRIALATGRRGAPTRVGFLDVATGSVTLVPGPAARPDTASLDDGSPVFSPDGRSLAFVRGHEDDWSEIWLYSVSTHTTRRLTDDHCRRFKSGLDW